MEQKLISVIVTIYNTPERYLRKCIESIINQTLREIEIILVNDGSEKSTRNICKEYEQKDKRIKLINQKNMGESVSRNVGIECAKTNNITFVDSDDWIEPNMCEELVKSIDSIQDKFDIIIFDCYVNYTKKQIKNNFYPKEGKLNQEDIKEIQLQNIEKGISKYYPPETNISVPWAKVYSKKFIEKNKLKFVPGIIRMPDAIFNMYAYEKAKRIYKINKYLYHYNKNDFSICQKYSKDTIKYYETYFEFVKKYIEKFNKDKDFKDLLNVKIVTSIDVYMYNYFFHKDNKKRNREKRKEFIELLDRNLYVDAIKNVKKEYLSKYQKIVRILSKNKKYIGLKLANKTKCSIKKFNIIKLRK